MKYYLLFFGSLIAFFSYSQSNSLDSSYYDNGSVRSILFKQDMELTGYQVEVFYARSSNIKKLGNRLADTIYEHQPKWPIITEIKSLDKNLIRISRCYLPDSSYIEKYIFISSNSPLIFSFSSITTYFKKERISITCHYKNRRPIALYIGGWDFSNHKKTNSIVNVISEKELGFKYQDFLITNDKKIRIEKLDTTMCFSRIIFQDGKETWSGSYIEFYPNTAPKEFGYNLNKSRSGIWYEFYDQGNLKATGKYNGIKFDEMGNAINLKNGEWKYFDEFGKLIKTETWVKGKLK